MTIAKLYVEHCDNPHCDRNSLHEWIDTHTGLCARCVVREALAGIEDLTRTMAKHELYDDATSERVDKICNALERMIGARR